ncbi:MAG: alpha/beta hydrolase [Rhodospirillaceae bacterium]|jgi:acylglycerol lipase|nr:alpha/beta hydrolase [Rhodospirillaceae bacterium]MBT4218498.1 alpha/beta hydrolase [Rhodospirillaceae bacterium]MBT4463369.1 alpha/beta hydrolase [Rhodospirillaceae bacterium]MBT5014629.1 alpha/beta hydrolase [Rhodospirillaceae bacterium]MBT5308382.1 alpha/beta hydrolase [Rhodospirillaceae bacterium]
MLRTTVIVIALMTLGACSTPLVIPPGPHITNEQLNDDHFISPDGTRMPVKSWLPTNPDIKAVLIALHGFNDYSNFFAAPGAYFADRGIAAYAYDQRGFGDAPNRGIWSGVQAMTDDLKTISHLIAERHPGVPLFLIGESMGGAVIITATTDNDAIAANGIILAAPAVWGRDVMPWYQTAGLWLSAHVMPGVKVTGRGLKIKPSDNIEMLRALGRDPLVIKATRIDAIYGLTNLMDAALDGAAHINGPTLILFGEKDDIIPKDASDEMRTRLSQNANDNRRIITYQNGYHMLLRDLQAETVWRDIVLWIDGRIDKPLASGAQK